MNLVIVEGQPAARVGLRKLCEGAPDMRVVGEACTGAKALEAVESLRPDLMLLDADLPDMPGLEVLRALKRHHERRTIFITANPDDAPGAFAAGALDFLVKPVNGQALATSLLRARAHGVPRPGGARRAPAAAVTAARAIPGRRPLVLIGEREHRLYPIDPLEIDYVRSAGNYVTYHLGAVGYMARESIKRLDALLAPAGFVRIERSVLLNIRAVAYAQSLGHGAFVFTLTTGERLQSGHAYRDTVLAALPLRRRAPNARPAQLTDRTGAAD
ncbi:MAG TPA: LytTR family DNA-binding domain-containing protein [Steroidobacteraceae bacterium]|nr:LytTR family DNA-binding domain-containing protein [Steroidobacteraceae bacterium]